MLISFIFFILVITGIVLFFASVRRSGAVRTNSKQVAGFFWTACATALVAAMIIQPGVAFDGATIGLKTWWNIVFPSLLPFFIASELLMNFGLISFIGILMEPLMRPLFNVPGNGAFVFCIGYTSGYPIGAMVTARLRSQGLCTRIEAERLVCFTSNASPLFMIVAVSVGMFGRPEMGVIIAGAHYLGNLTLGLVMRFYGRHDPESIPMRGNLHSGIVARALSELFSAWRKEDRTIGKIIGDTVRNAVNNLLNIGGFIILFAVIIKILTVSGFIGMFAELLGIVLVPLGLSPEVMPALASGFFEMTIGSKIASDSPATLAQQVTAVAMILAWSGLSGHAQVASMLSDTDIRMMPFIVSRVAHAALAALYTIVLFRATAPLTGGSLSVPAAANMNSMHGGLTLLASLEFSGMLLLFTMGTLLLGTVLAAALYSHRG